MNCCGSIFNRATAQEYLQESSFQLKNDPEWVQNHKDPRKPIDYFLTKEEVHTCPKCFYCQKVMNLAILNQLTRQEVFFQEYKKGYKGIYGNRKIQNYSPQFEENFKDVQKFVYCCALKKFPGREAHIIIEMPEKPDCEEFQDFTSLKEEILNQQVIGLPFLQT